MEPHVGGRFSIFGGSVLATFTKLEAQTICLDWRFTSWHEKDLSKVRLEHTHMRLLATASEVFVGPCTHQHLARQQADTQQQALKACQPCFPHIQKSCLRGAHLRVWPFPPSSLESMLTNICCQEIYGQTTQCQLEDAGRSWLRSTLPAKFRSLARNSVVSLSA